MSWCAAQDHAPNSHLCAAMGAAPVTLSICLLDLLLDHPGYLRPHNVRESLQPLLERTTTGFGYLPSEPPAANKGIAGGSHRGHPERRAKAQGMDLAHRLLAKCKEGKLPHWPEAPTPTDGVEALFPIIFLALPGTAEPRSLLQEALCKDLPCSTASSPRSSTHARPVHLGGTPRAAFTLGLGQPIGPERKAEHRPGQQSQAQRVRFGCRVTEPHWVQAQTTQGSESAGSAYVRAVALRWVKDKRGTEGTGRQQQLPGREERVQHGCRLGYRDGISVSYPVHTSLPESSQEGVISSKG